MTQTISNLSIEDLSVAERLDLIERLCDSLPEQVEPDEIPAWHIPLLEERMKFMEANPGRGRPWREAMEDIRNYRK